MPSSGSDLGCVRARGRQSIETDRLHLQWRIRSRRSRAAEWPASDDALGLTRPNSSPFSARHDGRRSASSSTMVRSGPRREMTAGIDLVLALIDHDLGPDVAKTVARLLVMNQRRLGGQKQHSALLDMTPSPIASNQSGAYPPEFAQCTDRRGACDGGQPQPPPVQPCVFSRDRSAAGQSRGATPA